MKKRVAGVLLALAIFATLAVVTWRPSSVPEPQAESIYASLEVGVAIMNLDRYSTSACYGCAIDPYRVDVWDSSGTRVIDTLKKIGDFRYLSEVFFKGGDVVQIVVWQNATSWGQAEKALAKITVTIGKGPVILYPRVISRAVDKQVCVQGSIFACYEYDHITVEYDRSATWQYIFPTIQIGGSQG